MYTMAVQKLISLVFLIQLVLLALALGLTEANYGLRIGYYQKTCPDAELIVHRTTYQFISKAPTLAAPLLRMHFHDCFVRGCDGSVLLNPTKDTKTEKLAIPNQSLRGYQVIDAAKSALEKKCPGVVSCADILALVARDAVAMINGPYWDVHTGRRDGRISLATEALANLPSPFANITQLKKSFASKGLSVKDLVVLSGAHTIGIGHCFGFLNRLYNFTGKGDSDPSMDPKYVAQLKRKCKPEVDFTTFVEMDPGSFRAFDDHYYTIVAKRRGLFQSDAALLEDYETGAYVKSHANNKPYVLTFAQDFAASMVKMGAIEVFTGKAGEIRKQCGSIN